MNIIFTGLAGLKKVDSIKKNVIPFFLSQQFFSSKDFSGHGDIIRLINFEERLIAPAMRRPVSGWRGEIFHEAVHNARERYNSGGKAPFNFLSMHMTWQASGLFFSPLSTMEMDEQQYTWKNTVIDFLVDEFQPDYIITFIDDIHNVQSRLQYHFRLIELLRWRNVEMVVSDLVSHMCSSGLKPSYDLRRYPFHNSPIFSIKQSCASLYKYIFEREVPRVYLSYPISEPRRQYKASGSSTFFDEINAFRAFFDRNCCAFDPVAIDERPLKELHDDYSKEMASKISLEEGRFSSVLEDIGSLSETGGRISEELNNELRRSSNVIHSLLASQCSSSRTSKFSNNRRWPSSLEEAIGFSFPSDIDRISIDEIADVISTDGRDFSEIDSQISSRDFRLIDQSDLIIVYRPTYKKSRWSRGTQNEADHAISTYKSVIVISDTSDHAVSGDDSPFKTFLDPHDIFVRPGLDDADKRNSVFEEVKERIDTIVDGILKKKLR